MRDKKDQIERRLRRLSGMSADKLAAMHAAAGSQEWWCKCWNCKKSVQAKRDDLEHSNCPHCGMDLWKRT